MTPNEIDRLADAIAERLASRVAGDAADVVGDVHDAARWLNVSVPTVERAVRRGVIPSFTLGRLRRFRRSDVLAVNKKRGCGHGE